MSIKTGRLKAFTLLEVLLAVTILALVGLSIYKFVETTISAVQVSTKVNQEQSLRDSFAGYLHHQMLALPAARAGALTGESHRFNGISCDELSWIARPGSSLLTRHASGEWQVTLTTKQLEGGEYEMGLRRQDIQRQHNPVWLPLLRPVNGFEVRYFDPSRKEWIEKWEDPQNRPSLVKVKLWRSRATQPSEWIFPVPIKAQPSGGNT